jgi:hypothetical protein
MQPGQKSNVGTIAAVLGGLAAVGGIAAAAFSGGKSKAPLKGARPGLKLGGGGKKPCGCGR